MTVHRAFALGVPSRLDPRHAARRHRVLGSIDLIVVDESLFANRALVRQIDIGLRESTATYRYLTEQKDMSRE